MATTSNNPNNDVTIFKADFFREYVRESRFAFITGPVSGGATAPIMIDKSGDGKEVSFPLITSAKGVGVSGTTTLDGNEEIMSDYDFKVDPEFYRNGVRFNKQRLKKPAFDQLRAARPWLMDWSQELTRDQTIEAFAAVNPGTTGASQIKYADASEADKDTYLTNNSDRFLFGNANSNLIAGDHSASLANIDSTNDKLNKGTLGIAKRLAAAASPRIRPWKLKKGSNGFAEMFVMLVGQNAYRDFYNDSTVSGDLQNARERAQSNPIFMPGDLVFDNVLVREIPEITFNLTDADNNTDPRYPPNGLSTAGNGGIAVEPCFLLGAQAVANGIGQDSDIMQDNAKDYGFQPGVAVELMHEIKKVIYNKKQHGMVTVYVSGVSDS